MHTHTHTHIYIHASLNKTKSSKKSKNYISNWQQPFKSISIFLSWKFIDFIEIDHLVSRLKSKKSIFFYIILICYSNIRLNLLPFEILLIKEKSNS